MASIKQMRQSAAEKTKQLDTPKNREAVKNAALTGVKTVAAVAGIGVALGAVQVISAKTVALMS